MDIRQIPVRVVGAGSQPDEDDGKTLSYIDMPGDMWTYAPPPMPQADTFAALAGARETMHWLQRSLEKYCKDAVPQLADLTALATEDRELVNQILGEGEVQITSSGTIEARTQESVLAGIWRTIYIDAEGRTVLDVLEVADAPHVARSIEADWKRIDVDEQAVPADVMNALPILVEVQSGCAEFRATKSPHSINLSLLPLSDSDLVYLDEQLGRGPVDTLSRAYGKCQVSSTLIPDVWWVRYYNSMGILILNTIEVTDVPAVICAAPEDLEDSAARLEDLLTPYWSDVA